RVMAGVEALRRQSDNLVIVTNDVGSDDGDYPESVKEYICVMGRINASLAAQADAVAELVCGIPIVLKGELPI
ncbi:MAG: bifunctional adenosylcobinamide kinase/adenosylcobinamide-phosphate guanylyltransferase, partial [Oscillospiraceae bacterium]|nr:bifunctional adenosylcobinamide kinase/adenosylcobinamide-phosphate guanylyltransferase [Oscillospiraceae bacterium]